MQALTISSFLQGVPAVTRLAKKVRDSVHSEERDSYKNFVKYSSLPNDSNSFYVDVLHVRFIGRLEYIKYLTQGREFTSCQYVFFKLNEEGEERTTIVVRFIGPQHAILTNGDVIDLPLRDDDDDGYEVSQVRGSISQNLLEYVIGNLQTWSF